MKETIPQSGGVEKSFPATKEGMAEAQSFLDAFLDDPRPAIIMDEIVSNIVRCSGARLFSMRFSHCPNGLEMRFSDDGQAFDPTTEIAAPDLDVPVSEQKPGGLGMFMVRKMSRSVAYERTGDGRNVLTVVL